MATRHNRENGTFLRQLDTEKYRMDAGIYPFAVQLYLEIGRISACSRNVLRIPIITYYTGCLHVYCHKQILQTVTILARWASAGRDDLFFFAFCFFLRCTIPNLIQQRLSGQACMANVVGYASGYPRDFSRLHLRLSGWRNAHASVCQSTMQLLHAVKSHYFTLSAVLDHLSFMVVSLWEGR